MEDTGKIKFYSKPNLRSPYVICGFEGSFNGGDVSIGIIEYLIEQFKAIKFAEMETSRYHIYQLPEVDGLRPIFKMQDGLIVESELPTDEFYCVLNATKDHDLILFSGNGFKCVPEFTVLKSAKGGTATVLPANSLRTGDFSA